MIPAVPVGNLRRMSYSPLTAPKTRPENIHLRSERGSPAANVYGKLTPRPRPIPVVPIRQRLPTKQTGKGSDALTTCSRPRVGSVRQTEPSVEMD